MTYSDVKLFLSLFFDVRLLNSLRYAHSLRSSDNFPFLTRQIELLVINIAVFLPLQQNMIRFSHQMLSTRIS